MLCGGSRCDLKKQQQRKNEARGSDDALETSAHETPEMHKVDEGYQRGDERGAELVVAVAGRQN